MANNINGPIWGYGFQRYNKGARALYSVEKFDYRYLVWPKNLSSLVTKIVEYKPRLVIGLGMAGAGKKVKVEEVAKNNFRKRSIETDSEIDDEIQINGNSYTKELPNGFYFASTIGRSFCNRSAWKIQKAINDNNLPTKLLFIHICKAADPDVLHSGIQKLITQFQR